MLTHRTVLLAGCVLCFFILECKPVKENGVDLHNLKEELIYACDFSHDTDDFVGEGPGNFEIKDGKLRLDCTDKDKGVLTVWLKREFQGNIHISYQAKSVDPLLAGNINMFLNAKSKDGRPVFGAVASGNYGGYHEKCNLYIVTLTGKMEGSDKNVGWSRVRKDPGFTLLSENMDVKTEHNHLYRIDVYLLGNRIVCRLDGKTVHDVTDTEPYTGGAFGFRTWNTRLWVDDLNIFRIE